MKLGRDDLVFCYPDGRALDPSTVPHAFARVLREAGLPHLRFHDLRHTHATFLLGAGVNHKVVSERLGHASVTLILDNYTHVMPALQEAAAERLNRLILPGLEMLSISQGDAALLGKSLGVLRQNAHDGLEHVAKRSQP